MIDTTKFTTTLRQIQACRPCADGWHKLLGALGKTAEDDEPLSVETILNSNGYDNALWALRAVEGTERELRLLACDYAARALDIWVREHPRDHRPAEAIATARLYADDGATIKELESARAAASAAGWDAVGNAGDDAASSAASSAAWAAAPDAGVAAAGAAWDALSAAFYVAAGAEEAARAWQEARMRQMIRGEIYREATL